MAHILPSGNGGIQGLRCHHAVLDADTPLAGIHPADVNAASVHRVYLRKRNAVGEVLLLHHPVVDEPLCLVAVVLHVILVIQHQEVHIAFLHRRDGDRILAPVERGNAHTRARRFQHLIRIVETGAGNEAVDPASRYVAVQRTGRAHHIAVRLRHKDDHVQIAGIHAIILIGRLIGRLPVGRRALLYDDRQDVVLVVLFILIDAIIVYAAHQTTGKLHPRFGCRRPIPRFP